MPLSPLSQGLAVYDSAGCSDFSLALTGYADNEDRVLHLRNANRDTAQTREFLDWRYRQLPDMPSPCIAWLMSSAGEAVGMAAAVFRAFWVNGALSRMAVVGDISLDKRLRGKGVGQQLLVGLSRHLEQRVPGGCALVIPTEAARRSLDLVGWRTVGRLIPYVCPIKPAMQLTRLVRSERFSAGLCWPIRSALSLAVRLQMSKGFFIEVVDEFDEKVDQLWARVSKVGWILGDKGRTTLTWRYRDHPNRRFRVAQLVRGGELRGFLVFEMGQAEPEWTIQDIVVADQADLSCMLALFLFHCIERGDLVAVRLVLSDWHPYARRLWRLGFIARAPLGVFQVLASPTWQPGLEAQWCLTAGDKDI
jgi:GNAT superfamily N-acetyltransferase